MEYIKNDFKGFCFDTELGQAFTNKPTLLVEEKNIIKLRNDRQISDSDMKIVKFLFHYRFATVELLYRMLNDSKKTLDDLKKDISRLTKHRIINSFALVNTQDSGVGTKVSIPVDAMLIYCLDIGGRILMEHFHNADTTAWYTTENMRGPEKIGKDLLTNAFLIRLMMDMDFTNVKENYFELNPNFSLGKSRVIPSFEMKISNGSGFKYYVGDIVRRYEFPLEFREHLTKLDSVFVTNAWKKHFYDLEKAPLVLFICEDDEHALEVAKMLVNASSFDAETGFRLTTDARVAKGLGLNSSFLYYDKDSDKLVEKAIKSFVKK